MITQRQNRANEQHWKMFKFFFSSIASSSSCSLFIECTEIFDFVNGCCGCGSGIGCIESGSTTSYRPATLSSAYTACRTHTNIEKDAYSWMWKLFFFSKKKKRFYNRIDIWYLINVRKACTHTCAVGLGEQAQQKNKRQMYQNFGCLMCKVAAKWNEWRRADTKCLKLKWNRTFARAEAKSWSRFSHECWAQFKVDAVLAAPAPPPPLPFQTLWNAKNYIVKKIERNEQKTKQIMAIGSNSSKNVEIVWHKSARNALRLTLSSLIGFSRRLQYFCHGNECAVHTHRDEWRCETLLITLSKMLTRLYYILRTMVKCVWAVSKVYNNSHRLVAAILVWKWINKCENHQFLE